MILYLITVMKVAADGERERDRERDRERGGGGGGNREVKCATERRE